jgi:hypothetical protein
MEKCVGFVSGCQYKAVTVFLLCSVMNSILLGQLATVEIKDCGV